MTPANRLTPEFLRIRDILNSDWHPLGVDPVFPPDEYDIYIPRILDLIRAGANSHAICDYLTEIRIRSFDGPATYIDLRIAERILRSRDEE